METSELKLEDLLKDSIASPPSLYLQLQKALQNPETTYVEFARIISSDIAFASRILRITNSPFYGFSNKVDSIVHAIDILGVEKLSDLAIAALVIDKFKGIPRDCINIEDFWKHSIGCGLATRAIAGLKNESDLDRYYICGLIHDIGSLLFYSQIPIKSRLFLSEAKLDEKSLSEVENKHLHFDHAKLGGELLKKWRFPEIFQKTASFHHHPLEAGEYSRPACVVHLSDIIAFEMKLGSNGESNISPLFQDILEYLELSQEDISSVKDTVKKQYQDAVDTFLK
ncbi:hypothetical protein UR09_01575 [Candidatus Nitromaritima sp. SCGC AAA799-A02]|nr:hypothetical protein UZ36_05285 [Candidatus Nitromaritima sp. SCGC AAA799-C22]KMP12212.1 hypothetical protein UR09_01575 [Candidatus Nitromaritima sp. SCGC AAA799-A02]